jgi:hypothetical protein
MNSFIWATDVLSGRGWISITFAMSFSYSNRSLLSSCSRCQAFVTTWVMILSDRRFMESRFGTAVVLWTASLDNWHILFGGWLETDQLSAFVRSEYCRASLVVRRLSRGRKGKGNSTRSCRASVTLWKASTRSRVYSQVGSL